MSNKKLGISKKLFLDFFLILIFTLILLLPALLDDNIIRTNDIIGNIADLIYIKSNIVKFGIFPSWNPYLNLGLPIFSDPLNAFLNPLVFISFMTLSPELAIKVIYTLSAFFAGISFYAFCKYFRISRIVTLILSFTFISSGYLIARIFAGHLEKILAYSVIPLILLFLFKLSEKGQIKKPFFYIYQLSLLIVLLLFSGSIYEFFYFYLLVIPTLFIISITDYFIYKVAFAKCIKRLFYISSSLILVIPFGAIKLIPIYVGRNYIDHISEPFVGSHNPVSILYNFFWPYKNTYTFINLSKALENKYVWWENLSYIGPISLPLIISFFILLIFKKIKVKNVNLILSFSILCIAYAMIGYFWNPFHLLFNQFPFLQQFRIPGRIFIILIPLLLIMVGIASDFFIQKSRFLRSFVIILLVVNLYFVFFQFRQLFQAKENVPFYFVYSKVKPDYYELLEHLKSIDSSKFFIAQSSLFQYQLPLNQIIENEQFILNSTYGYGLKSNKSSLAFTLLDFSSKTPYAGIYPKYFIYPKYLSPPKLFDTNLLKTGSSGSKLYKNSLFTPFATINHINKEGFTYARYEDKRINLVKIEPNKILVKALADADNLKLSVMQSEFIGWKVYIDGKEAELNSDPLLSVNMKRGFHSYSFEYHPTGLGLGLLISLLSLSLGGIFATWNFIIKDSKF